MTPDRGRGGALLPVLAAFALAVVAVGPGRETAVDDDWAYALTVRALLETGTYAPHDWVAANPVFHVVWGGLGSLLLGPSMGALRASTLLLALAGLVAFDRLARDHGLRSDEAALLTASLLAGPLFLRLAFSFMTDVPYLALCLLALLAWSRALGQGSVTFAFAGSLCAAAAILTRQFGVVLIVAFVVATLLRARPLGARLASALVACATALPALAALWQRGFVGSGRPRSLHWLLNDQVKYLSDPALAWEWLWRPAVAFVYLGAMAAPVLVAAVVGRLPSEAIGPGARRRFAVALGALLAALALGWQGLGRPLLLPLLPFSLDVLHGWPRWLLVLLTGQALLAGAALVVILAGHLARNGWRLGEAETLVMLFSGLTLVSTVLFVQYWDRYLLPLVPAALLIAGRALAGQASRRALAAGFAVTALAGVAGVAWVRAELVRGEAIWTASERVVSAGVAREAVLSSWEWGNYNGFFDRFVAQRRPLPATSLVRLQDEVVASWHEVYPARAAAMVGNYPAHPADPDWVVASRVPIRDEFLREQTIYVLLRRKPVP
ncbi:MAG: hypothetical protein NDJ94_09495 [Vicinamibacteria bacterium]|nr:hypothetical protein [Vicinamibacteria bacterium]